MMDLTLYLYEVTKKMPLTFYLMMFALKHEHVSAIDGAPDGSS